MGKPDEEVIHETGVVRLSCRQLSMLWLELTDTCAVDALIDIQQPDNFTDEVSWSIFRSGNAPC